MYESLKETFEDTRNYGYSPAFLRRIKEKRMGMVRPEPKPEPKPVAQLEFKAKHRDRSATIRRIRHEQAAQAAVIRRGTVGMTADPSDIDRTPAEIIEAVGNEYGVTPSAIRGGCRVAYLVAVRHRAIVRVYLAKSKASMLAVSRWFGIDHTTVFHAVKKAGVHKDRTAHFGGIRYNGPA